MREYTYFISGSAQVLNIKRKFRVRYSLVHIERYDVNDYPGSKNEKLLDSQIGHFLAGKLGGLIEVERLIKEEKLLLIPMSDCRGYDTTGTNAGIYVTEAQNMSVEMMKLLLQRIGDDCICILDGDDKAQVDMEDYAGHNNGLARVSEIFRGQPYYGEVTLKNCYRSEIAKRAEMM